MWVKLSDDWLRNKKIRAAGRDARDLWLAGITYCNASDTKGFIPDYDLELVAVEAGVPATEAVMERLFDTRITGNPLWHIVPGGWQIHDYTDFQLADKSPEEKEALSQKRSEIGKKGATARWLNGKPDGKLPSEAWQTDSKHDSNLPGNNGKPDGKKMPPYPESRTPDPGSRIPSPENNNNGTSPMANGMANHDSEFEVVVAELKSLGISEHDARGALLLPNATPEAIRQQIEWLPHRNAKIPPKILLLAIREGWAEPDGAKQAAQRQAKSQQAALRTQDAVLRTQQAAEAKAAEAQRFLGVYQAATALERQWLDAETERLFPAECPVQHQLNLRRGKDATGTEVLKLDIRNRLLIETGMIDKHPP